MAKAGHKHEWICARRVPSGSNAGRIVVLACPGCGAAATAHATPEEWQRASGPSFEWKGEAPVIAEVHERVGRVCAACGRMVYVVETEQAVNAVWSGHAPQDKYVVFGKDASCPHCGKAIGLPPSWKELLAESQAIRYARDRTEGKVQ